MNKNIDVEILLKMKEELFFLNKKNWEFLL